MLLVHVYIHHIDPPKVLINAVVPIFSLSDFNVHLTDRYSFSVIGNDRTFNVQLSAYNPELTGYGRDWLVSTMQLLAESAVTQVLNTLPTDDMTALT